MSTLQARGRPNDPPPGAEATILSRDGAKSVLAQGTYGGSQGLGAWVDLDAPDHRLEPGQGIIIASGPIGARVALLASIRDVRERRVTLVRQSPWRKVDTRTFPRFGTSRAAVVFAAGETLKARIADISLGGMALEVNSPVAFDSFDVRPEGESSRLPCLVVGKQERTGLVLLHLEFGILDREGVACVGRLVAVASGGEANELLAS